MALHLPPVCNSSLIAEGRQKAFQSYLEQQTDDLTCSFKHYPQDPCPAHDSNDHHTITVATAVSGGYCSGGYCILSERLMSCYLK